MKTIDYINTLIKEKEELKALCKSHVETIRLIKKELNKLNTTITKKDKKILKLESESLNVKTQKELDKVKSELIELKAKYDDLHTKYDEVVRENVDLRKIFDEIENICDSD
jgi:chromosome segregation ATPase